MMIHFALADAGGRSVAVEYIDNEMTVTETPVVTNFYLTEGEKHGIGTSQSHDRYESLMERLEEKIRLPRRRCGTPWKASARKISESLSPRSGALCSTRKTGMRGIITEKTIQNTISLPCHKRRTL